MNMLSQRNTRETSRALSGYLPPHWLEQYENLMQPSGGFQINRNHLPVYTGDTRIGLDPTAGSNRNPWLLQDRTMQMDLAIAVLAIWSAIPGVTVLGLLGTTLRNQPSGSDDPYRILTLNLENLLFDDSGSQAWNTRRPTQAPADTIVTDPALKRDQQLVAPSIKDIENFIVSVFTLAGLNELAKLCSVSRQALYDWRKPDAQPEKEKIKRLYSMWDAARNWVSSGFPPPGTQLHMPMLKKRSLYDYLSDAQLDFDAISFIGHRFLVNSLR